MPDHSLTGPAPVRPAAKIADGAGRPAWRRWLAWIHLWVGLVLCLPLVAIGLTGSVLVFDHELQALIDPPPPATAGAPASLAAMVEAARAAAPAGAVITLVTPPAQPGDMALFRLAGPNGGPGGGPGPGNLRLLVDPVSLAVRQPAGGAAAVLGWVHALHANLLAGRDGRPVVGVLGVVMLVLGVSGLVLWWPRPGRWRTALTVRRGASGLRLHRDLHGAVGFWALAVFLLVSASGVALAFPQTVGGWLGAPPAIGRGPGGPAMAGMRGSEGGERAGGPAAGAAPVIDIDAAVVAARTALPGSRVRFVGLPQGGNPLYRVMLDRSGNDDGAPAATALVDGRSGRVTELRDPRTAAAGTWLMAWMRPLHAGAGLGPLWTALVFAAGFLPPLFAVTGVAMWLLKRQARRRGAERRDPRPAA